MFVPLPGAGGREGIFRVLVVVISGSGPRHEDMLRLPYIIADLKRMDINVFVVVIGEELNKQKLRFMVSKDSHLLDVESFSMLTKHADNLPTIICRSLGK